jgi:hypothetical protein
VVRLLLRAGSNVLKLETILIFLKEVKADHSPGYDLMIAKESNRPVNKQN